METWKALTEVTSSNAGSTSSRREECFIRWKAPPIGWFALNSDEAAKGTPRPAGGGSVIRNAQGELIRGYSANFGICSSFRAEIKAVAYGLDLAKSLGIQHLVIQMDNLACIQMISSQDYGGGACHHLLNRCRALINDGNWRIRLEHCYREGNKAADYLANHGVIQEDRIKIIQEANLELKRILQHC